MSQSLIGFLRGIARFLIPGGEYFVLPIKPYMETTLRGNSWAYTVTFRVENAASIEKLISCESQGVNITRPDSNGLMSWGILQFNRHIDMGRLF
jgi:hypothetical protein